MAEEGMMFTDFYVACSVCSPSRAALLTQKMTQETVQHIQDHNEVPFFLYLAHPAPHHPPPVSPEFQGLSAEGTYGDSVEELDWSTGEILKTVRKLDLTENTCIVYASDNGPWLDAGKLGGSAYPLRDGKSSAYEGGLRVPCVMWWPGMIPAGTVCSEVATTMDSYVTFPALLDIELPQDRVIDGKDILPLLLGEEGATSPHEYFLCYGESIDTGSDAVAIRYGNWKYFYGTGRSHQLYDLSQEVGELTNVSLCHSDLCETLWTKLLELDAEVEANSRPIGEWSDEPNDANVTPPVVYRLGFPRPGHSIRRPPGP
jgi:arylsulfatase A